MKAEQLANKIMEECDVKPFKRKYLYPVDGRLSCVFEHFDITVPWCEKAIDFTMDAYCERVREQYIALSIRFGGGVDKERIFRAIEPLLKDLGFEFGKLTPRSHARLMLRNLNLSPDGYVSKVKEILATLSQKKTAITAVVSKL